MAAKKKQLDEVVKVEEVDETETAGAKDQDTAVADAPTTDTPAPSTDEMPRTTDETPDEPTEEPKKEETEEHPPDKPAEVLDQPEREQLGMENEEQTPDTQGSHPSDFFGTPEPKSGGGLPKAVMAVLALLLVGGGVAGFMFLKSGGQFLGVTTEASPTPMEETSPSPEASPAMEDVDLTEISVRVLNGSGTAGEAGKVKALLEKAGFKNVKTGNAPSEDNTVTTISAKAAVPPGAVKAVEAALKGSFTTEVGDALGKTGDYDIVVTTGGASKSSDATGSAKEE